MSLFPMLKTSVSIPNLPKTDKESIILQDIFTTTFPSNELPSSYLTLTFLTLFHIPNLHARHFPTTEALTPVSTTASISSPAKCNLTINSGVCREAHLMASNVLPIHFPNSLQNQAL